MAKRKKKQTAVGLFFSFFLKAIVIILGLRRTMQSFLKMSLH